MTFDPFGDFETRGYLRNLFGEKDPEIVRHLEHSSFVQGVDEAFRYLAGTSRITYHNVLNTHQILFGDIYPWAGQDRTQTTPDTAVSKGPILFAHPNDARRAVEYALDLGQMKSVMAERPGEVIGYLAYGHPFLDGNGRTIMVVHTELAQRAGIGIDWASTDKVAYLTALTCELDRPGKGYLDDYLRPFIGEAIGNDRLATHVSGVSGIDGTRNALEANNVLGSFSDPDLQARYQHQQERRGEADRTR